MSLKLRLSIMTMLFVDAHQGVAVLSDDCLKLFSIEIVLILHSDSLQVLRSVTRL